MPRPRLSVRKIREILRLHFERHLSTREIARGCGLSRSTVSDYLRRAKQDGLVWPLPAGLDDAELERRLFPPPFVTPGIPRPKPDWLMVHKELRRKGVCLDLLWQGDPPRGLPIQLVLRALPQLGREDRSCHAARASRRR